MKIVGVAACTVGIEKIIKVPTEVAVKSPNKLIAKAVEIVTK
ncbi:PTS transporter%2C IIB subunit [Streptococcus pneumoniae]|nr:PTS transporter%2C IIB subunit [Streptococcus pneumoniae]